MSKEVARRIVRPILSKTPEEARKGVNALYRDFYRELEWTMRSHIMDTPIAVARQTLKKKFLENKQMTDVRMIDMSVVKGRMHLEEMHNFWSQNYNIYNFTPSTQTQLEKEDQKNNQNNFLDKFYKSSD